MTPGLQRGPPFPSKATKNAVVAIASLEKPSVPMVVGICEIDVASLTQVQGAKGHAVRGEHWDGDEIWAWSSAGKAGGSAPERIEGWSIDEGDVDLQQGVEHLSVQDPDDDTEEGGVPLEVGVEEGSNAEARNDFVEGEDLKPYEEISKDDRTLSTKGTVLFLTLELQADDCRNRRHLLERFLIRSPTPSQHPQKRSASSSELPYSSISCYLEFRHTLLSDCNTRSSKLATNQEDKLEEREEIHQGIRQEEAPEVQRS